MIYAFTKYAEDTGNITGNGSMPVANAATQPRGAGEAVFVGQALHPSTHFFRGGQPMAYTPEQVAAKATRPLHATRWCNNTMQWLDERGPLRRAQDDLADVRLARRNAYPDVGDQLDMLWVAMRDGVLPKVEPFYSNIAAVKTAHPKPGQGGQISSQ